MKQVVAIIVLIAVGVGAWFALSQGGPTSSDGSSLGGGDDTSTSASADSQQQRPDGVQGGLGGDSGSSDSDETEGYQEYDERPAAEVYQSAEQALDAVKKGAGDYDDIVLEQFVEPGDDCTWCGDFYSSLETLMKDPNANEDEQAYYSEIFAISGRVENIQTLVETVGEEGDSERVKSSLSP